jgi:transposase
MPSLLAKDLPRLKTALFPVIGRATCSQAAKTVLSQPWWNDIRFVSIKTDDQLDLQALHRVRDQLMIRRTSVINQIRAFLLERGMVFAKSPIRLREAIPEVLENANENLTPRMRNLVAMLWSEWKDLELQIVEMNDEVERIASSDAACIRLRQIPGIGPLVATAIVASIGNGAAFQNPLAISRIDEPEPIPREMSSRSASVSAVSADEQQELYLRAASTRIE